jgi:hypothetical protein
MTTSAELNTCCGISLGLAVALAAAIAAGFSVAPLLTTSPQPAICISPETSSQASTAALPLASTARHAIERYWL